ncbi:MAG TPA: tyrosine-type recombinase/integrase [Pseudonocardiaceae bacterium]|jgi:site-specific recombinase XerD|nr:tyrosine-type recombinase/integrase [Pseudonocardiaceae bacterium]
MADLDLPDLLESWQLSLRAQRKSKQTLDSYRTGVRQFLAYCAREGRAPLLTIPTLDAFTAHLLDAGAEAATARARHMAVRYFSAWLASPEVEEIERDELLGAKPPRLDEKVVVPLSTEEISALIRACKGKSFIDVRDEAVLRFMLETGARRSEAAELLLSETDARAGTAVIRRGKGGKGRVVPFSPHTGMALDRYLRMRRRHRLAETDALWLGGGNQGFSYHGLWRALQRRARIAQVRNFHPHRMRNTMATRWLEAGGSQDGLMAVAGWTTPAMLHRYVKATASRRAAEEARRLNLGDL